MQPADIVIIGSGIGGATIAAGLAGSGAPILILERGERLRRPPETATTRAIFRRGHFRPKEMWREAGGPAFNPGNYYYVGGNSKFYGAVLIRYRSEDFEEMEHAAASRRPGRSPTRSSSPGIRAAEELFQVRGALGEDPTEPSHSQPYPLPPVPDEPPIAAARERAAKRSACIPLRCRSASTSSAGWPAARRLGRAIPTPDAARWTPRRPRWRWRCEQPEHQLRDRRHGRTPDAAPDGKPIACRSHYVKDGEAVRDRAEAGDPVAGADQVGRDPAPLGRRTPPGRPRQPLRPGRPQLHEPQRDGDAGDRSAVRRNNSVYQKTFGFNDYYLADGDGGPPLGNVQLLGQDLGCRSSRRACGWRRTSCSTDLARHAIDWYLMSEDLPDPESRVMVDGDASCCSGGAPTWRRSTAWSEA